MTHIEDVLLHAIAQGGDKYIFGAEAKASDPDPDAYDCSELIEWSCHRAGVACPDGAFNQWQQGRKAGTTLSVAEGIRTRGARLYVGDGTGSGRDAIVHVAWSLGDGTTCEARGSKWGVGTWPAAKRFDFADTVPGVDYSPGHGQITFPPVAAAPALGPEEDDMGIALVPRDDKKGYDIFAHTGWTMARLVEDAGELPELLRAHGLPEDTDLPALATSGKDRRVILAGRYAMDRVPKAH